jgi:hypothetical protein
LHGLSAAWIPSFDHLNVSVRQLFNSTRPHNSPDIFSIRNKRYAFWAGLGYLKMILKIYCLIHRMKVEIAHSIEPYCPRSYVLPYLSLTLVQNLALGTLIKT